MFSQGFAKYEFNDYLIKIWVFPMFNQNMSLANI
jgi:hypothetical protein